MSIAALSSTALSAGIDAKQTRFAVTSTSGINGLGSLTSPQSIIVVDGEAMAVLNVPVSGVVEVARGYESRAKAHASGASVFFAARSRFSFQTDGFVGLVGTGGTPDGSLPDYRLPLGSRRVENGKEYILVDFTETVHTGVVVNISNDGLFTAAVLTTAHQGAVGVVAEQTCSSDSWGWVQIYGTASAQDASVTSAATSAYMPIPASSVSSPAAGLSVVAMSAASTAAKFIYNMFITGAATTAVTSAASHTGVAVPVFLNYPYVMAVTNDAFS